MPTSSCHAHTTLTAQMPVAERLLGMALAPAAVLACGRACAASTVGRLAGAVVAGVAALLAYSWGAQHSPGDSERGARRAQARESVRASALRAVEQALSGELGDDVRVAATAALKEAGVELAEAPSRVYSLMLTILIDRDKNALAALTRQVTQPGTPRPATRDSAQAGRRHERGHQPGHERDHHRDAGHGHGQR